MRKIVSLWMVLFCLSACATEEVTFTDINWGRETDADTETIFFGSDGTFRYSCGCGNPVNDADLCEGYAYDADTKTITLCCIEETEEMVTQIQIVSLDAKKMELDFAGEKRVFYKEKG